MKNILEQIIDRVIGSPRYWSLEHRLFNSFSLLNGVSNTLGALNPSSNYSWLFALNLATGVIFLAFYALSRWKSIYRSLYWPFVMTIQIFLFFNILGNAGSNGGAHYYYIPAILISTTLSRNTRTTVIAALVSVVFTCAVFYIEGYQSAWIKGYQNPADRLPDVVGQFLFVQILCGMVIIILKNHFNDERNKSENLLLNILPATVAEELKREGRVEPVHYDAASVLFTDMVGFTKIAEGLSPQKLVAELDACFHEFDKIIRSTGVEKIKTIGDAYMAVGGLPVKNNSHALDCVLAALRMQAFMLRSSVESGWQIRLGIHTGSLVAGVVGSEKFAYDIWGDTVNTASRMESSGVAGKINISAETYAQIESYALCEYRGKLVAKNKGEIAMYFVNRLKPEYSADAEGVLPNSRLLEERAALNLNSAAEVAAR
ncbi:MAG: adenylate/guanylate cyclase domain-containing protein [Spirochaetota bacterium]